METIRPAHIPTNTESIQIKSKIPEYARDYKNEWLFIRGINKTCGVFVKRLSNVDFTDGYNEEVFFSPMAKALMKHFSNILKGQKLGYLKNIRDLEFKYSDFENINELYVELYDIVVSLNENSFFQYFLKVLLSFIIMLILRMLIF